MSGKLFHGPLKKETMMISQALAVAALTLLLAPGGGSAAAEDNPDHAHLAHRLVPIMPGSLYPKAQRIHASDAFGWLNYTTRVARVSFDKEVAARLTCKSPSGFHLTDDRFESRDIPSGGFTSLCNLAPGEYDYRVELRSGLWERADGVPEVLEGRLVVK